MNRSNDLFMAFRLTLVLKKNYVQNLGESSPWQIHYLKEAKQVIKSTVL